MDITRMLLIFTLLICHKTIAENIDITTEENSQEEELISTNYILPKQIFNDGKPFYLDKDPISGQLDFSSKKPAGIEPEVNEVIDPKEKTAVLSSVSPNFHDYLNLPVKYSSSKFVYPLVSSSYANLKYQGNNKNYVSNHKNYTTSTPTISTPKYYTLHKGSSIKAGPTPTKMMVTSSTWQPTQTTQAKQEIIPTKKIVTTPVPTAEHPQQHVFKIPTKSSTTISVTKKNTTETRLQSATKTTTTSTTNRPTTAEVTTKTPLPTAAPTLVTTTVPTTTKAPSTTASSTIPTISVKMNKTITSTVATAPTKKTSSSAPIKTTSLPISTKATTMKLDTTTEPPSTTVALTTLDASEVYNVIGTKKEPSIISLADLFNALAEEEAPQRPSNDGLDSQGNLMKPFSPGKPAPFTLQQVTKPLALRKPPTASTAIPIPETISTTTEKIFHDISDQDANNYVRYEVDQPNVMQMQYHPAPSMNNIVISPGQHSATFVLGSQQAVSTSNFVGTVEKESLFQNGERIQYGTVINEDIASAIRPQPLPLNSSGIQEFYAPANSNEEKPIKMEQSLKQELPVPGANVRFPPIELMGSGDPTNFVGIPNIVNGHAQPVALPHIQPRPVVFPPNENHWPNDNIHEESVPMSNIVFKEEDSQPELSVSQKNEILSLSQHNHHNQVSFPQLPEDLTPPQLPSEENIKPFITSSPPHSYNEYARQPMPAMHRPPNPERPLPNILPQFRPNAKISVNHHPSHSKESGNIRFHQKLPYPNRSLPPPFSHRRTPVGTRYSPKAKLEPFEANRRVYKIPPQHPIDKVLYMQRHASHLSPVFNRPPPPQPMQSNRYVDNFGMERHPEIFNNLQSLPSMEVKHERLPAFEEEDLMVEDPPKPAVMETEPEPPKSEPVITLQMLKSHKKTQSDVMAGNEAISQAPKNSEQPQQPQNSPVYVVYPVKSSPLQMDIYGSQSMDDPIVIGQRGEQPPQPPQPAQSSQDKDVNSDYQNTPFSVIRDHPQEPILMAKNKSQSAKGGHFPYPLEKPDPAFAEFKQHKNDDRFNRNTKVELSPRVVNRGGNTVNDDHHNIRTEMPIALAYTPTEPPTKYHHGYQHQDKFSHPNLASPVIPEIRDTQTEAPLSEELDTRGQYFEKDFMAPFYPSMSLSSVTNSPNGWSVFPGTTDGTVHEKNNINRADHENHFKDDEVTTKKFDPDNFQPELQSGFKPIYPPGYKIRDSSEESRPDKPIISIESSSITTVTSTTTNTTEKPPERKKSKFEASIEALLFGDDDDFEDDDERTEKSNSGSSS